MVLASSLSSDTTYPPGRSATSCAAMALTPRRGTRAPPGPNSFALRPTPSLHPISSPCTRCGGKTLYVLFFIELSSRRVHVAGCTARPDGLGNAAGPQPLDAPLRIDPSRCDSSSTIMTPNTAVASIASSELKASTSFAPRSRHRANAFAERWVKTVKTECLDWMLVVGPRHLLAILRDYVEHYNCGRPHRGLELRCPMPHPRARRPARPRSIRRRNC